MNPRAEKVVELAYTGSTFNQIKALANLSLDVRGRAIVTGALAAEACIDGLWGSRPISEAQLIVPTMRPIGGWVGSIMEGQAPDFVAQPSTPYAAQLDQSHHRFDALQRLRYGASTSVAPWSTGPFESSVATPDYPGRIGVESDLTGGAVASDGWWQRVSLQVTPPDGSGEELVSVSMRVQTPAALISHLMNGPVLRGFVERPSPAGEGPVQMLDVWRLMAVTPKAAWEQWTAVALPAGAKAFRRACIDPQNDTSFDRLAAVVLNPAALDAIASDASALNENLMEQHTVETVQHNAMVLAETWNQMAALEISSPN